jgi:hypothetical protein
LFPGLQSKRYLIGPVQGETNKKARIDDAGFASDQTQRGYQ